MTYLQEEIKNLIDATSNMDHYMDLVLLVKNLEAIDNVYQNDCVVRFLACDHGPELLKEIAELDTHRAQEKYIADELRDFRFEMLMSDIKSMVELKNTKCAMDIALDAMDEATIDEATHYIQVMALINKLDKATTDGAKTLVAYIDRYTK